MTKVPIFSFVCFFGIVSQCCSEPTAMVNVTGAIQTGIGKYIALVGRTLSVTCTTRHYNMAEIWILKDNDLSEPLLHQELSTGGGVITVNYDMTGDDSTTGNYTCRFTRNIKRNRGAMLSYVTESTVELKLVSPSDTPSCWSSLGQSGLMDEVQSLVCSNYQWMDPAIQHEGAPRQGLVWRGLDTSVDQYGSYKVYSTSVPLQNQPSQLSCGYFQRTSETHTWKDVCSLPPLTVVGDLNLRVYPQQFSTRNTTLQFTCESNPPATVLRWSIFGHNGNIISDYLTTRFTVDTEVTITQAFGKSVLKITGSAILGDGVHAITCSATRINYKIAASQFSDTTMLTTVTSLSKGPTPIILGPVTYPSSQHLIVTGTNERGSVVGYILVIIILVIVIVSLAILSMWLYRRSNANIRFYSRNNNEHDAPCTNTDNNIAQQGTATYEALSNNTIAPPAYADLDVGYSAIQPQLDDQQYMEPTIALPKGMQI